MKKNKTIKKIEKFADNYREKIKKEGVNISFLQYVKAEEKNDPNFFRNLFEEDFENDFDRDLSEEQREQYSIFLNRVIRHRYERAFYCTDLEGFANIINKIQDNEEDPGEWDFTVEEIVRARNPHWEDEDEYDTDIAREGDYVLEFGDGRNGKTVAQQVYRPKEEEEEEEE